MLDSVDHFIHELFYSNVGYFTLRIFIQDEMANGVKSIGPKTIESIYHNKILGGACKTYFQHYYDRLRYYEPQQEQAAKTILKQLALTYPGAVHRSILLARYREAAGGAAANDDFNRLMGDLENDFYVRFCQEDDGYTFACKILCDWWRRYYTF